MDPTGEISNSTLLGSGVMALGFYEAARCCGDGQFQNTSNFIITFIKGGRGGGGVGVGGKHMGRTVRK